MIADSRPRTATDERYELAIVGGGPTGHAAAKAYREAGGSGRVVLISADTAPPYNRPPLSKDFLRGETAENDLFLDDDLFYARAGIEMRLDTEVAGLDLTARAVRTTAGQVLTFRQVILALGAAPQPLPVPGGESAYLLRFLPQARTLLNAAGQAGSAVVVGSGFIGCEAAASLAARGLAVTQLSTEPLPQLRRLGRPAAERIDGWLADAGVRVIGDVKVAGVDGREVRLADGRSFRADLVLAAVGVKPQAQLAAAAGLALERDRIVVDEHMRTGQAGVLAAGDVALAHHATAGRRLLVEHWGEAERMGEIAGRTATGQQDSWSNVPGFWSEIGGQTLKYAAWGDGFDEARLQEDADGFTIWYSRGGHLVGVLTSGHDDDYDRGPDLIADAAKSAAQPNP